MRGGDNLSIQVSADTSKLREDLAKAEAELRGFNKELRKAADAGDTTRIEGFSRQVDSASRSVAGFKRQLRGTPAAANDAAGAFGKLSTALEGVDTGFALITRGAQAFAGLAVFDLMRKGVDQLNKSLQDFRDTRNVALGTGFTPESVKGFQIAMRDAGDTSGKAGGALVQFAGALADAQKNMKPLGNSLVAGVNVMKGVEGSANHAARGITTMRGSLSDATVQAGKTVEVFAGSVQRSLQQVADADPFKKGFDLNVAQFQGVNKLDQALEAVAKRFVQLRSEGKLTAEVTRSAALLFGEDDITKLGKALENIATKGLAAYREQAKQELPTKPQETALQRYDEAWSHLRGTIAKATGGAAFSTTDMDAALARGIDRTITAAADMVTRIANSEGFNTAVDSVKRIVSGIFDPASYQAMWATFQPALQTMLDGMSGMFASAWETIKSSAQAFFDWMTGWLKSIGSSIGTMSGNAQTAGGAVQFASGGTVPGSGSGDTVPAMLTPGEFVVRKSAVAHYGTGFLRQLNAQRYALGGIVDRLHAPVRGFADGGLVTAETSDGVAVNLHFPGSSFGLRGDKAIIAGLTREARRAGMRSAGRMPGMAA